MNVDNTDITHDAINTLAYLLGVNFALLLENLEDEGYLSGVEAELLRSYRGRRLQATPVNHTI